MWRWSWLARLFSWCAWVFSTYVEVILIRHWPIATLLRFLHVCGGDPECGHTFKVPRVFSTYVEVILSSLYFSLPTSSFLHVCGGDPLPRNICVNPCLFSPRMWRWSCVTTSISQNSCVFSTYVEVIPKYLVLCVWVSGFLHVCGGDPQRTRA